MPGVWVAIVLLVFIVIPWALSYFCVRKGYIPLKSGGKIERATDPVNFWISVGFYALIGTTFFIFNPWLSWQGLSRSRLPFNYLVVQPPGSANWGKRHSAFDEL